MGDDYKGWRSLEITADEVAIRIAKGIARDRDVIQFPLIMAVLARGAALLPESLRGFGMRGFRFQIWRRH
jgi:hypothetical protein